MATNKEIVSWDSVVIIDAIQKSAGRYEYIEPMISAAENGELLIVVSEICVAETLYLGDFDEQGVSRIEQERMIENWFENPYILPRNVDRGVSKLAAKLRSGGLKTCDAIVAATAIQHEVPILFTNDDGKKSLLKRNGKLGNPPLTIIKPADRPGQQQMFMGPSSGE